MGGKAVEIIAHGPLIAGLKRTQSHEEVYDEADLGAAGVCGLVAALSAQAFAEERKQSERANRSSRASQTRPIPRINRRPTSHRTRTPEMAYRASPSSWQ